MRVIIETRAGKRWGFDSLKLAKQYGCLKHWVALSEADSVEVINGKKTAIFKAVT